MPTNARSNYKEIYCLTEKLFGNKLALPVQKKNYLTRWNDLSEYWKYLQSDSPLYVVMHKIHWGRYPDGTPLKTHMDLYNLLEAEILNRDSSIHKAKKSVSHTYYCVYNLTYNKNHADVQEDLSYHSDITQKFMYHKTLSKLPHYGRNMVVGPFQNVICKLIPAAKKWTDAQWSDDCNIFNAIQEKYDIDYRLYPEAFGQLYNLLDKMCNQGKRGSYSDIFGVERLSWKLAEEIWPKDTKRVLLNKFCAAKKHIRKNETASYYRKVIITEEILSKSWVMRYLNDLYQNKEEKKMLFDVMTGRFDGEK